MRQISQLAIATCCMFLLSKMAVAEKQSAKPAVAKADSITPSGTTGKNEMEWNLFWKHFTRAIGSTDRKKIESLSATDFFDGGGGTVQQWLDAEVYSNAKTFTKMKSILKKGVRRYKGFGNPYKATGKNKSGDLFFEYKNHQWLFGGLVGD